MGEINEKPHLRKVVINTAPVEWDKEYISYEDIVGLTYPGSDPAAKSYKIVYDGSAEHKPDGSLTAGEKIKAVDGLVINVTEINAS